jgi:hypothetical protein
LEYSIFVYKNDSLVSYCDLITYLNVFSVSYIELQLEALWLLLRSVKTYYQLVHHQIYMEDLFVNKKLRATKSITINLRGAFCFFHK